MRTNWSQRADPEAYQNFDEKGSTRRARARRRCSSLSSSARAGLRLGGHRHHAGQGYHLRPPYPCHYFMHGAGRYGLQCLTKPGSAAAHRRGADLPAAEDPEGQRSPLRVLALVGGRSMKQSKVAVVTGGSAGIGKAICERCCPAYEVVSLARRQSDIDASCMHSIEVDLADRAATAQAARELTRRFDVTTVVHNAGVIKPALLPEVEARRPRHAARPAPRVRDPARAGRAAGDAGRAVRPRGAAVVARGAGPRDAHQLLGHEGGHAGHGAHLGAGARAPPASPSTSWRRARSAPTCSTTWSTRAARRNASSPLGAGEEAGRSGRRGARGGVLRRRRTVRHRAGAVRVRRDERRQSWAGTHEA